jgi:hypothetical protein
MTANGGQWNATRVRNVLRRCSDPRSQRPVTVVATGAPHYGAQSSANG